MPITVNAIVGKTEQRLVTHWVIQDRDQPLLNHKETCRQFCAALCELLCMLPWLWELPEMHRYC